MKNNRTNELLNQIREKYDKMSKGQKLLADYITENYDKAVFLTASRLGKDMTVIRNFRRRWRNWCGIN